MRISENKLMLQLEQILAKTVLLITKIVGEQFIYDHFIVDGL
jgi:hypothetical protein